MYAKVELEANLLDDPMTMRGGGGLEFLIAIVVFLVAIGGVPVPANCKF